MITVNMHKAKTTLSKLVQAVLDGELVRIARDGKPVVELKPVQTVSNPLKQDPRLKVVILEDPSLPEDPEGWD